MNQDFRRCTRPYRGQVQSGAPGLYTAPCVHGFVWQALYPAQWFPPPESGTHPRVYLHSMILTWKGRVFFAPGGVDGCVMNTWRGGEVLRSRCPPKACAVTTSLKALEPGARAVSWPCPSCCCASARGCGRGCRIWRTYHRCPPWAAAPNPGCHSSSSSGSPHSSSPSQRQHGRRSSSRCRRFPSGSGTSEASHRRGRRPLQTRRRGQPPTAAPSGSSQVEHSQRWQRRRWRRRVGMGMGPLQACDTGRTSEDIHFTGKQRTGAEFGKGGGAERGRSVPLASRLWRCRSVGGVGL